MERLSQQRLKTDQTVLLGNEFNPVHATGTGPFHIAQVVVDEDKLARTKTEIGCHIIEQAGVPLVHT